jgi:predicted DNA-binding transcriptional regulator YafY
MPVLSYACLDEVRRAIRERRLVQFNYRKAQVIAEPHLLGNAIKTRALILCAWELSPDEGWQHFRYAEMRDVRILHESFHHIRPGFNPHDRRIIAIDTTVRRAGSL